MRMTSLSSARSVPSSPLSRVVGFGQLGLGMAAGAMGELFKRTGDAAAGHSSSTAPSPGILDASLFLTQENGERLAASLSKMRGAALKLGQMLSMQDEGVVPPQWTAILDRVRQGADPMPQKQLLHTLDSELGPGWRAQLSHFKVEPIASASIGQVHAARMLDGRVVAMKVQYPGVARSIDSDLDNLLRLSRFTNILPPGLYVAEIFSHPQTINFFKELFNLASLFVFGPPNFAMLTDARAAGTLSTAWQRCARSCERSATTCAKPTASACSSAPWATTPSSTCQTLWLTCRLLTC
jgi:hypothetical protein